jgi:hypothetical protein
MIKKFAKDLVPGDIFQWRQRKEKYYLNDPIAVLAVLLLPYHIETLLLYTDGSSRTVRINYTTEIWNFNVD